MTSKLKIDVIETLSGGGTIALANQFSGMTHESMPSGSVIKTQHYYIGSYAVSAGTLSEVISFSFDKLKDDSYLLVTLNLGINHEGTTNNDNNSAIYLKNNTTVAFITNSQYVGYAAPGAIFATDTNNVYGSSVSGGSFTYYNHQVSAEVKDTSAMSGTNVIGLSLQSQNSTLRIGRWQVGSLTITEIKQ